MLYDFVHEGEFNGSFEQVAERLRSADLDAVLSNAIQADSGKISRRSVAGLVEIPGRTRWQLGCGEIIHQSDIAWDKPHGSSSRSRLCSAARRYADGFEGQPVGVELSGGLDTSLIIEILSRAGKELGLIGIVSDRYEFRTERAIQLHYASRVERCVLIPQSKVLPFLGVSKVPKHPVPSAAALYYDKHLVIAAAAQDLGISCLLHGGAGDNLLCLPDLSEAGLSVVRAGDDWDSGTDWVNRYAWQSLSLAYVSAFSLRDIARFFISARRLEAEDPFKLWARRSFSDLLPTHLTRWAYKASHEGWICDGLRSAEDEIGHVVETAAKQTSDKRLAIDEIMLTCRRYAFVSFDVQQMLLAKLTYCVWVNSLLNN